MQLLAQEEYGLRCLAAISRQPGNAPQTIQDIARAEGLSSDYAAKLLRALRRGGLVASTRGASGGYRLTRPAAEISLWDGIQVLGGSLFPERFCACHPGQQACCIRRGDCSLRPIWQAVDDAVQAVLSRISLADLQRGEPAMHSWIRGLPQVPRSQA